jgi:DMSO/TMAO reductase YedYZ heme-binding membrane subunit
MAETPNTTAPTRRRLPGTRWSTIRLNLRWAVQALALIAGIYFFMRAFDTSKALLFDFSGNVILSWAIWVLLFSFCFLALMFTSYLKERGSGTLRKRIAIFEKLVAALHLNNYSESGSEGGQPA